MNNSSSQASDAKPGNKPVRAIFGGTFNPVHKGHTGAIEILDAEIGFKSVHFVLSARPPHKGDVTASVDQRFTMLELALADYTHFYADDTEMLRPTVSYTMDTVTTFKARFPRSKLVIVIGSDSLLRLHTWYQIDDWIDKIDWVVLARPGYDTQQLAHFQNRLVHTASEFRASEGGSIWIYPGSNFDVSSTELRRCLRASPKLTDAQHEYLDTHMAPQVRQYIQSKSLYTL